MDGLPDVIGQTSSLQENVVKEVAINQGDGEFEKEKISFTFTSPDGSSPSFNNPVDINNDGYVEYITERHVFTNEMTGTSQGFSLDLGNYEIISIAQYAIAKTSVRSLRLPL